jgi:rubrerythrin
MQSDLPGYLCLVKEIGAHGFLDVLPQGILYLCPICGDIEFGEPPAVYPACKAKGANFVRIQ